MSRAACEALDAVEDATRALHEALSDGADAAELDRRLREREGALEQLVIAPRPAEAGGPPGPGADWNERVAALRREDVALRRAFAAALAELARERTSLARLRRAARGSHLPEAPARFVDRVA